MTSSTANREGVNTCEHFGLGDATVLRRQLGLTVREFQVLDYVRGHRPRAVPYDELKAALFGEYSDPSNPRVMVRRIRRKLGPKVLVTEPGFGVRFGFAPMVEANLRCLACGRPVACYEDEWVCHACGAMGGRRQIEAAALEVGRVAPKPGTRQGQPWTEEERAFVAANWGSMSQREIGEQLARSESAVRGEAPKLRLPKKPYVRGES
jgi:hypothetical protein